MPSPVPTNQIITAVIFLLIAAAATTVSATDHIVGANRGWNPGINYTLWANNNTFYVGDLISFRYQKNQYNVFEVNQTGYDNCTFDGVTGNWTSGKDFIPLTEARRYYFICGTGGCFQGMKVTIRVLPLPSPPSAAAKNSSTKSDAAVARGAGSVVFGALVVAAASIWLGSGFFSL